MRELNVLSTTNHVTYDVFLYNNYIQTRGPHDRLLKICRKSAAVKKMLGQCRKCIENLRQCRKCIASVEKSSQVRICEENLRWDRNVEKTRRERRKGSHGRKCVDNL